MDDPNKRGEQDRDRIALHQEHEASYWTKALGVTREQLQAAVEAVGDSAAAVRRHLGKG